jgi:hypothetical protein
VEGKNGKEKLPAAHANHEVNKPNHVLSNFQCVISFIFWRHVSAEAENKSAISRYQCKRLAAQMLRYQQRKQAHAFDYHDRFGNCFRGDRNLFSVSSHLD